MSRCPHCRRQIAQPVGLSATQAVRLQQIRAYIAAHREPPSFAQMKALFGVRSKHSVHRIVHGLADRGHLRLRPNVPHSIMLTESG